MAGRPGFAAQSLAHEAPESPEVYGKGAREAHLRARRVKDVPGRLHATAVGVVVVLAAVIAPSGASAARHPVKILGMHVVTNHGPNVQVHAHQGAVYIRVTGSPRRKLRLLVDGQRRARAQRVPFVARISAAGLSSGAHTIVIAAVRGAKLSRITFAVRRVAPRIKVVSAPPAKTRKRTVRFAWRTTGAIKKTTCRLDAAPATPCTSPQRYSGLKRGAHTFKVVILTSGGIRTALERNWVVTKIAPLLTFLTTPAPSTTSARAHFTWRTRRAVSRTLCRLDGAAYRKCTQRFTVKHLAPGAHTFDVQVTIKRNGHTGTRRVKWTVTSAASGTKAPGASTSTPPGGTATAPLGAPFAAGSSAGNFQFGVDKCQPTTAACVANLRFMLRWVARHTGVLSTLYLEFAASSTAPVNCPTSHNGYGGGTSGTAMISTYAVNADGTPNTSQLLSRTQLVPCQAAIDGSVAVPLGLPVSKGQEFATVVQNVDPDPVTNFFSVNNLYFPGGLLGANGRNERSSTAVDAYYGLDPREIIGSSRDGGATWSLPEPSFVPTYVQVYADGYRDGQPYLYATCPCPGTITGVATMVFPHVPVDWTISQLGAYTVAAGAARVDLLVNDQVVASATLSGSGFLRASITPVTVPAGSTVKIRTIAGSGGLALSRIDADTPWKSGPVLTLGTSWRWYYLEQQGGGAGDRAVVGLYPLPMYPTG
jgi:hypothetical protein